MTRRQSERQVLERKVRNWSAVVAGGGAIIAATSSQAATLSLFEKWSELGAPGVIVGVLVAVGAVYANAFGRMLQERRDRALEPIDPRLVSNDEERQP